MKKNYSRWWFVFVVCVATGLRFLDLQVLSLAEWEFVNGIYPLKAFKTPDSAVLNLWEYFIFVLITFLVDIVMCLMILLIPKYLSGSRAVHSERIGQLIWIPFLSLGIFGPGATSSVAGLSGIAAALSSLILNPTIGKILQEYSYKTFWIASGLLYTFAFLAFIVLIPRFRPLFDHPAAVMTPEEITS